MTQNIIRKLFYDTYARCQTPPRLLTRDLRKPFPLSFSSHPGLAMLRGPKVHSMGEIMYIGDADSDKIVNVTVEQPGGGEDPLDKECR